MGSVDLDAQYFTAKSSEFQEEVAHWQHAGVAAPWAVNPEVLVLGGHAAKRRALPRCVGVPRMSMLGRHLAAGLDARYAAKITTLRAVEDGWRLETGEDVSIG